MHVRVLRPDDPEWDTCLGHVRHDIYHLSGYHAFEQYLGNGDAHLVVAGDGSRGLAWPYLLRPVNAAADGWAGLNDVTSVYGYPGPLGWGVHPGDPFLDAAWEEIRSIWRSQRVVSAFTRFHPLLDNACLAKGLHSGNGFEGAADGVLLQGPTLAVDCTLSDDEVSTTYHRSLRQHLRVSRRKGMTTEEDPHWRDLEAFTALYQETMARNRAAASYVFSAEDFARLRSALPEHAHLLVTRLGDDIAAAGIFTTLDGIVQAHLVASSAEFRLLSPTKVLLDDARRWARERGNRVLHLGGGRGGREDSLFRFKREFSSERHGFSTGRWVLDADAYRDLVRDHEAEVEGSLDAGYFPAYRAPAAPLDSEFEGGRPA